MYVCVWSWLKAKLLLVPEHIASKACPEVSSLCGTKVCVMTHPPSFLSNAPQLPGQKSCGTRNHSHHVDKEERPRHLHALSGFTYSYLCWRQSQDYTTELKRNGIFDFTIMPIADLIRRDLLQGKNIPQSIRYVYTYILIHIRQLWKFCINKVRQKTRYPKSSFSVDRWGRLRRENEMSLFLNSGGLIMQTSSTTSFGLSTSVTSFEFRMWPYFINFCCRLMRKIHLCSHGSLNSWLMAVMLYVSGVWLSHFYITAV
jgi:hypothetical protein